PRLVPPFLTEQEAVLADLLKGEPAIRMPLPVGALNRVGKESPFRRQASVPMPPTQQPRAEAVTVFRLRRQQAPLDREGEPGEGRPAVGIHPWSGIILQIPQGNPRPRFVRHPFRPQRVTELSRRSSKPASCIDPLLKSPNRELTCPPRRCRGWFGVAAQG